MKLMVAAEVPAEYVLATGISHRLSFFIARAFAAVGIQNWEDFVVTTEANQLKVDTNLLMGDSRRAFLDLSDATLLTLNQSQRK